MSSTVLVIVSLFLVFFSLGTSLVLIANMRNSTSFQTALNLLMVAWLLCIAGSIVWNVFGK